MSGDYSVKSGYWLAHKEKFSENIRLAEMNPSINEIKQKVWLIQTVPKIKALIWKVLGEAITVVDLIAKRRIQIDSKLQICGNDGESINHVLFSCTLARHIWAMSSFPCLDSGFDDISLFSNIHYVLNMSKSNKVPLEVRRTFPWLLWFMWKNRNGLFFEGKVCLASKVVEKAQKETELWFLAQSLEKKEDFGINQHKIWVKRKWSLPHAPWLKCNIGVAWSKEHHMGGASWILRNSIGKVLLHSIRCFSAIESLDEAKIQTHLWASESMVSHKVNRVFLDPQPYSLSMHYRDLTPDLPSLGMFLNFCWSFPIFMTGNWNQSMLIRIKELF